MSTDRELLELAAKAAGIVGKWATGHQAYGALDIEGIDTGAPFWWNPMKDDGDALRLAARLKMTTNYHSAHGETRACVCVAAGPLHAIEFFADNEMPATRRAIARVAAELGKFAPSRHKLNQREAMLDESS